MALLVCVPGQGQHVQRAWGKSQQMLASSSGDLVEQKAAKTRRDNVIENVLETKPRSSYSESDGEGQMEGETDSAVCRLHPKEWMPSASWQELTHVAPVRDHVIGPDKSGCSQVGKRWMCLKQCRKLL